MKAVTWRGVNEIGVEDVEEPRIINDHDIILQVGLSATCGSDLHLREAVYACRKGGTVFTLGVFAGLVDKFPLGAVMNKALTLRGAQQHGHRYIPQILDHMSRDEVRTEHLATHVMPLEDGPKGYEMFKNKEDGCVRAVFRPGG